MEGKRSEKVADLIQKEVSPDCNIAFGASIDAELNDEIQITIIATGFDASQEAMLSSRQGVATYNIPQSKAGGYANPPTRVTQLYSDDLSDESSENSAEEYTPQSGKNTASKKSSFTDEDDDELDKPAFLRRSKQF